jgi:hypothetical protein
MNPFINHPPPSAGFYVAMLIEGRGKIPYSTNKILIHKGISINNLPLSPSLSIASSLEKFWCFSAEKSIA